MSTQNTADAVSAGTMTPNEARAAHALPPVLQTAPAAIVAAPVGVGTQTYAGYGTAGAAFVAALIAFLSGDRSDATTGGIVAGVVGLVALVVTSVLRVVQARENAKTARTAIDAAAFAGGRGGSVILPAGPAPIVTPREPATGAPADIDDELEEDPGEAPSAADLPLTDPAHVGPDRGDAASASALAIKRLTDDPGTSTDTVEQALGEGVLHLPDEESVAILTDERDDAGAER